MNRAKDLIKNRKHHEAEFIRWNKYKHLRDFPKTILCFRCKGLTYWRPPRYNEYTKCDLCLGGEGIPTISLRDIL